MAAGAVSIPVLTILGVPLGLLGFVWRRQAGEQRKWFCSEAVAAMLGYDDPWRFDPMTLYVTLTRGKI